MRRHFLFVMFAFSILPAAAPTMGRQTTPLISAESIIDKAAAQERDLEKRMAGFKPLIETYIQNLDLDRELGVIPKSDKYFLGKLDLSHGIAQKSLLPPQGWSSAILGKIRQMYSVNYLANGFADAILLGSSFDRTNYNFTYVRREFLGEVRCVVFDVVPKRDIESPVAFAGRVWIEDQDFNIVRFNGAFQPSSSSKLYFHFDSWRENAGPGLWLPAYVYTEESDIGYFFGKRKLRFKGQTRLWSYNPPHPNLQNESTSVRVESKNVKDETGAADATVPVDAFRAWEREAEDNVLQRLELAGLLAPEGAVNQVLETVITNLEVTNNIDIQPNVRARILLTTPIESFTVGHTVVISRGLIDVLPDEASLALVLAHEVAHIALGHRLDTKYAFNDRMLFADEDSFKHVAVQHTPEEEAAADSKALEYLKNSPYRDKLPAAALFLRMLDERAPELPALLRPHLGNQLTNGGKVKRMSSLIPQAPALQMSRTDQLAALPLGSRIRVDIWNNTIDLIKAKPVALLSAREKMPFEVTPVFLYLTRQRQP